MNEEQIIENENYNDKEEEIIQDLENTETVSSIISVNPEEYNISDSFFNGVQIGGTMCLLSLGIAVIISILRRA